MSEALPDAIEITELPDGTRYRLPQRELGNWRYIGLVPIAVGLIFCGFGVTWILSVANMFQRAGGFAWPGLLFAIFGAFPLVSGASIIGFGIFVLAGHAEIDLRRGKIVSIERWGLLRWPRRCAIGDVRRFLVCRALGKEDITQPIGGDDLAGIWAEGEQKKMLLLAPGYPRHWLLPLANDLARRCDLVQADSESLEPTKIAVEEQTPEDDDDDAPDPPMPPAGCDIDCAEHPEGVTLTVPPSGLWKGSRGLFLFSMIWIGFMIAFTWGLIASWLQGGADGSIVIAILVSALFWAVGIFMLMAAINMGRRRAVLAAVGDQLMVLQTDIFGAKRHTWSRDEILDIRCGPSGMEVNETPILELQVHPREGKKFGLLSNRNEEELRWLVGVLRKALRLQKPTNRGFVERTEQPENSQVTVVRDLGTLTLDVPALGIWRGHRGLLIFGFVWIAFTSGILAVVIRAAGKNLPIGAILFGLGFTAIGLAIVIGALHMGIRRAAFAVVDKRLLVFHTGLFGSKRWEWDREELTDVRIGPSGTKVNDQAILELQFLPKIGSKVGLLSGRDEAELAWLATTLRRELRLPVDEAEEPTSEPT